MYAQPNILHFFAISVVLTAVSPFYGTVTVLEFRQ